MIRLSLLPARFGDSIWLEYGDEEDPHRILIDGGTGGTRHDIRKKINTLPLKNRKFELIVVTHIDKDHIAGILGLLEDQDELDFEIGDFWFNAFKHLPEPETEQEDKEEEDEAFGAKQGERLSLSILKHGLNWNEKFQNQAVMIKEDELPKVDLPGGMKLTLLSPTSEHLQDLWPKWVDEVQAAGMIPGGATLEDDDKEDDGDESFGGTDFPDVDHLAQAPFTEDTSVANGSSIAFLAEIEDSKILLCGDAFPSQILASLNTISPDEPMELDLVKISHHGSSGSTSMELLNKLNCKNYIISTNGSTFKHPKSDTISRIIKSNGPNAHLIFNYKSKTNEVWDMEVLKQLHNYTTDYPLNGEEGLVFVLKP